MKVKELIAILELYNPELDVCIHESTKSSVSAVAIDIRHVMSFPKYSENDETDYIVGIIIDKIRQE